ncbi:MAG: hypothetical protein E5X67_07570 [Mesorhizobium sp.]|uniref:DUF3592 domain-containing protein n=1 Tax=Mesorhizobium sp. TaxID=1871066 RepID=UPI00120B4D06|nr:hypothetical protein [Mesorhizobium sp.]TIP29220.1 MAG: hypothetical protein E5X67_07570 [Mesorhizobium sp.]
MESKVPLWFEYVFFGFLLFFFFGFLLATWQERKFAREAEYWPIVNSIIVERLFANADPTTYNFKVRYEFNGAEYTSIAKNFFGMNSENKHVGDDVLIKVDPKNPESCVLFC